MTRPETKPHVLFICTHNAARGQIAEAPLRHYAGERFEVLSADATPTKVHPLSTAGTSVSPWGSCACRHG